MDVNNVLYNVCTGLKQLLKQTNKHPGHPGIVQVQYFTSAPATQFRAEC